MAHYRDRVAGGGVLDITSGHSRFDYGMLELRRLDQPVPDTQSMVAGLMAEDRLDARGTWSLPRGTVVAGIQAIRFTGDHDHTRADFKDVLVPHAIWRRGWRVGAFANTERSLGDAWVVRAGLRADWFAGLGVALAPLAELARTGEWWKAKLGVARSHQMLASLRDEEAIGASAVAYDLMVPVERGPLPSNTEVTAGWEGGGGSGWRVRLDAYARRMGQLRLPEIPDDLFETPLFGDPEQRALASGTAAGIEASWSWSAGPLASFGSYRWGRVTRTVDTVSYVPRFHRDHELEFGAALQTGRSTWSARLSLRSGQPYTPVRAAVRFGARELDDGEYYPGPGGYAFDGLLFEDEYNTGCLRPYRRLDISWRLGAVGPERSRRIAPFVSVINLFLLPNPLAVEDPNPVIVDDTLQLRRHYSSQFPLVVFAGVEFRL